jgi:hypothetical protein
MAEEATQTADETTAIEDNATKAQEEPEANLLLQIAAEYALCDHPTWRNKQLKRLKLYNNQARDESKVGTPCSSPFPDRVRLALRRNQFKDRTSGGITALTPTSGARRHRLPDAVFHLLPGRGLPLRERVLRGQRRRQSDIANFHRHDFRRSDPRFDYP